MSAPVVTVNVRNLAVGGEGVGEVTTQTNGSDLLGITAFVPYTAIGEVVTARVQERKKNYLRAQLLEVERSSVERVSPRCDYYFHCGGCELQHISYEEQLRAKQQMIIGALRAARLESGVVNCVEAVIPSRPYGYRRRISLHIDSSGRVGFYRAQSRSVVAITSCVVAVTEINEALSEIQNFGKDLCGKISSLQLEADDDGVVVVLKSPYDLTGTDIKFILACAKNYFANVILLAGDKEVGGFGRQILALPLNEAGSILLHVPAGSFSQVNTEINQQLIRDICDRVRSGTVRHVLDLYAGAGNFSIPLGRAGSSVTAVETDKRLVSLGRDNANRYSLGSKVEFVNLSVEKFIGEARKQGADVIVADPPRNGLGNLVRDFDFGKLFFLVSCQLPSFVRDLRGLIDSGWKVETIRPYDMFAQTSYLETLAVLVRNDAK